MKAEISLVSFAAMIFVFTEQFEAIGKITYGASAKFIYSVLESYVSTGVAADLLPITAATTV